MPNVVGWNYPFARGLRFLTSQWVFPEGLRETLARGLFKPSHQTGFPYRVRLNGKSYRGTLDDYLDWRIFFLGSFERETVNLCRFLSHHTKNKTFCDIGANKGLYSILLADCFSQVFAFEPMQRLIDRTNEMLVENGITNVEIIPSALGDADLEAPFFLPPGNNTGIGSLVPDHIPGKTDVLTIKVREGDLLFAEKKIVPGLMKIDTEGFEWNVLTGLRDTLARHRPFIAMEIGDSSKAAFNSGGGVSSALPKNYSVFEISDHSTTPQFYLKRISEKEILSRTITNNLLCPDEHLTLVEPFMRN